jgi:hypothetical protein
MSAKQEDRKADERGLELAYLGDLTARALGRCVAIDLAFVYASERFLAFDGWPAYAKIAAGNAASVLARLGDTPLAAPISLSRGCDWLPDTDYPREWNVRLAIFRRRGRRALRTGVGHAGRATDHLGVGPEVGRRAYSARNVSRACDGRADRAGRGAITSSASQPPLASAVLPKRTLFQPGKRVPFVPFARKRPLRRGRRGRRGRSGQVDPSARAIRE